MGRLHVSLTYRLSIKGWPRKNFLKMGRRTKKFEKPCRSQPCVKAPTRGTNFVLSLVKFKTTFVFQSRNAVR